MLLLNVLEPLLDDINISVTGKIGSVRPDVMASQKPARDKADDVTDRLREQIKRGLHFELRSEADSFEPVEF